MERHQRLQQKIDRSSSTSIDRSSKFSPFATRGFGVQQKASTSTPASKTELWENYQRSTQMGKNGAQKIALDRSTPIQAKLSIGQAGDKYEQEADSVADRVMSMSEPAQVQREELEEDEEDLTKPLAGTISPLLQRDELSQEEDEDDLQTKAASTSNSPVATTSLEDRLSSSKGGGSPLSAEVQSFMEPRFGADFSGVRVHTGSDAVQMNRDVNAQAFAHGKDALTAHELTHVVQQTGVVQRQCRDCADDKFLQRNSGMSTNSPNFSPPGPGSKKCLELFQKILDLINGGNGIKRGLVERFMDMLNDEILYQHHRTTSNPHPTKGSWDGHVQQYNDQQRGLNNRLNDWIKNGCDGPGGPPLPEAANEWVKKPAPTQPKNVSMPDPTSSPDSASSPEPTLSYTTIRNAVIALGISVTLIGLIVVAVLDPEPLSKLAAIGLTIETAEALMIALGMGKAANVY
jgi:hypothetical protein